MGDRSMGARAERFVREFGKDIRRAYSMDLGETIVDAFLHASDESFEVKMRYVAKDRRGDEYLLESVRVFYSPGWDLDTCSEDLAELLYPGNGEAHFDEILARLDKVEYG